MSTNGHPTPAAEIVSDASGTALIVRNDTEEGRALLRKMFAPAYGPPRPAPKPMAEQVAGFTAEIHKHPALRRIYGEG